MSTTSKGEQLEIYAAGSPDVIGLIHTVDGSWHAKVQIPGKAAAMAREEFDRMVPRMERFRDLLCRYLAGMMVRTTRRVGCVSFHPMSARVCSWLATAAELAQTTDLLCTQQCIADALGARRATITVELGALQRERIVRCERGKIRIIDQAYLRKRTCDCFKLMRSDRLSTTA
jgi:CRP-like cAMP-binding protein